MDVLSVYDSRGDEIKLGSIIGKGGEGSVYSVENMHDLAAKIYHSPLEDSKTNKLKSMAMVKNERLLRVLAWPVDTLHSMAGGPVTGILIPRVHGYKEIHKLYGAGSRIAEFPYAGWDFLICTAANLARAFSVIHGHGHVVGDVNPGNIMVSGKATVMLIDADSCQVNAGGRVYPCNVGVAIYQPPELQDEKSFEGLIRTPDHDNFGLAVLIFQLLFMGRHPFSARYTGPVEMPLERAIKEKRFVYGSASQSRYMRQPPGTLPMSAVSKTVEELFKRAFLSDNRPDGREWSKELESLLADLKTCGREPSHKHLRSLTGCPWCRLEGGEGVMLFSRAAGRYGKEKYIDIEEVWASINVLPPPEPLPDKPVYKDLSAGFTVTKRKMDRKRLIRTTAPAAAGILCLLAAVGITLGPMWVLASFVVFTAGAFGILKPVVKKSRVKADNEYQETMRRLNMYLNIRERDAWDQRFSDKKAELLKLYDSYKELEQNRQKKVKEMRADTNRQRLINILDREFITESSKIGEALLEGMEELKKLTERAVTRRKAVSVEIQKCINILECKR